MGLTRSFVAIEVPETVADALVECTQGLRFGRRLAPEALHLTLAFLGDLSDEALGEVHEALGAIRSASVDIAFAGFGHFGNPRPRALYAGVVPTPELSALHATVLSRVRRAGLSPERRRFVPHVTLARFGAHGAHAASLAQFIGARPAVGVGGFRAVAFGLFASDLTPDGARYETLAQYPLNG